MKMKAKRFILMLLVMLMGMTGAWAESVPYIDADGTTKYATIDREITDARNDITTLTSGWYIVRGADVKTNTIICNGNVNLILADGAKLTVTARITSSYTLTDAGIRVSAEGASLTIYGQSEQTGQLIATGNANSAGIGGRWNQSTTGDETSHYITINGGVITATGGVYGAGIGGGHRGSGYDIKINSGVVTANGGRDASAIGSGFNSRTSSSDIFVNSSLVLYADGNNPPTSIIEHTSVVDVAGSLSGKQYAIVRKPVQGLTVTFDKQGGTGGTDQVTADEGAVMPTITAPTRDGLVFAGYFSSPNGSGIKYYFSDGTCKNRYDFDTNTTLYAHWIEGGEPYIDADGTTKYAIIDDEIINVQYPTTLNTGWYIVRGANVNTNTIICNGKVNLILADGAKLTVTAGWTSSYTIYDAGIRVSAEGASLTIYGQSEQTGQLIATGNDHGAGIGGRSDTNNTTGDETGHDITINGGVITATGGYFGAGIGGGRRGSGSNININGGIVTATGGRYSYAIGCGYGSITSSSDIFVNSSLVLYADGNNPPTSIIEHTSGVDVADQLSDKQYAIVRKPAQGLTVTFDKQDGTGGTDQVTAYEGVEMPAITVPTRDGVVFVGYYTGQNATGVKYYNADGTSERPCYFTTDITLYAHWSTLVPYVDADGSTKYAAIDREITSTTPTNLATGWYIVRDADVQTSTLVCEGAVHLILADGAKLTARGGNNDAGIRVSAERASLTIYGQSEQTGQLVANGDLFGAGIGGGNKGSGHDITINGGIITATGGARGAGIGGGDFGNAHNITINRGHISATGDGAASAIGGGYEGSSSNIFVSSLLMIYADGNNPPSAIIEHTSDVDVAGPLSGKKYAVVTLHMHNYEWVIVDEHQHKQVCTSEVGICFARERNEGEHNIRESILCDTENYQCDVCEYVDEAKKTQFDERDYFSLKAVDGDVTLGMQKTGAPDNCTLQVSADGNNWSEPMTLSETTANIVIIPTGETRYFRRGSTTAADRISTGYFDDYWSFTMDGIGTIEADGNMMSLLDMTCQKNTLGDEINAFTKLFEGCEQLKTVTINSQALMDVSYNMKDVFGNSVTTYVIGNGVTTIGNGAFNGNTAITSVTIPEGITSIGNNAFLNCSGLTSIEIPSTALSIGDNAFNRCRITQYTLYCPSSCSFGSNAIPATGSYKIIVPALTTHSWTSNPIWSTYGSHFTEPTFTLHANEDPDNVGNYYTTFFNSHYAYTIPSGVKAYTATIGEENNEKVVMLTAIEGDILPKGTAVLLHSNTTDDMLMTVSNENGNEYGENLFSGVDVETSQSGTNYMLSYGQNGLGFYKMKEDMMLSANKTFLPQSAAMANARAFRMVFTDDNEVDGIQRIENGESEIENSVIYNLNGMRLNKLQKGINIVNGKKVIVK